MGYTIVFPNGAVIKTDDPKLAKIEARRASEMARTAALTPALSGPSFVVSFDAREN